MIERGGRERNATSAMRDKYFSATCKEMCIPAVKRETNDRAIDILLPETVHFVLIHSFPFVFVFSCKGGGAEGEQAIK